MNKLDQIAKTSPWLMVGLIGIYLLSAYLQFKTLIGWDISNGLIEAEKLLKGGIYGKDFFEPSPPMFLFLYAIPVFIAQVLSIKIVWMFPLFVFILTGITLKLCYRFITQLFYNEAPVIKHFLLFLLTPVLILVPIASDFGQREHLLMIFILPYIFLMGGRFDNQSFSKGLLVFVGIWAGIGFAIKPFFIICYAMLELAYVWRTSNIFAWLRLESVIILLWVGFISILTVIFFPTYFTEVVLHTLPFYYASYGAGFNVIRSPLFVFTLLALLSYACLYKDLQYKNFINALVIGMISLLIAYLSQKTTWFYHIYPAYSLAIFSLGMIYIVILKEKFLSKSILVGIISLFFCLNIFILHAIYSPILWVYLIGILLIILCIVVVFFQKIFQPKMWLAIFLAQIFFLTPSLSGIGLYKKAQKFYVTLGPLQQFLNDNANNKSVYFLALHLPIEFPLISYTTAKHVSSFASLFWLKGYLKQSLNSKSQSERLAYERHKDFFVNKISEEILHEKPAYVFVEFVKNLPVDILPFLQATPAFDQVWKNYRFVGAINEGTRWPIGIYQLNE